MQITLTDEEDIPDGMQKLRTIYQNLLGLSYDNLRTRTQQTIDFDSKIKQKSEKQLFEELYENQNNQPMSIEQKQFVTELFYAITGGQIMRPQVLNSQCVWTICRRDND